MIKGNPPNKKYWENFARLDPFYYIDTQAKNEKNFWQNGQENYQRFVLPLLKKYQVKRGVGLDFGCGLGRHTFPMASFFSEMIGVDISEQMIKQARTIARQREGSIKFLTNEDFFSSTTDVDFIFSINVFQHLENLDQIEKILTSLAKKLKGLAYLHFDTRPVNKFFHYYFHLPDYFLPRSHRRGVRRHPINSEQLVKIFNQIGFTILNQSRPDSAHHFFLLKK